MYFVYLLPDEKNKNQSILPIVNKHKMASRRYDVMDIIIQYTAGQVWDMLMPYNNSSESSHSAGDSQHT